jgi:hypothetical protein
MARHAEGGRGHDASPCTRHSRTGLRFTWSCQPAILLLLGACGASTPQFSSRDIETSFAFTNFSTRFYAALRIRPHAADGEPDEFEATPLLPPGATHRMRFFPALIEGCPGSIDVQVFLYQRANEDVPIGLDEGEAVDPRPVVAGAIEDVPACEIQPLETYTIVNFDAEAGVARVKFAQGTPVEEVIRERGIFPNTDATWDVAGVEPDLADEPAPPPAEKVPISGRVTLADGTGLENVGVLIRARFRVRLNDADAGNDPDAGFGEPMDVTATDTDGAFRFERPGGGYQVEFFADDLLFRPPALELETPSEVVHVIAEPLL